MVTLVGVILHVDGDEGGVLATTWIILAETVMLVGRRETRKESGVVTGVR